MEMEPSRFASYRRIVARGRHITLTVLVTFDIVLYHAWSDVHLIISRYKEIV
jgi:hypothetical protein